MIFWQEGRCLYGWDMSKADCNNNIFSSCNSWTTYYSNKSQNTKRTDRPNNNVNRRRPKKWTTWIIYYAKLCVSSFCFRCSPGRACRVCCGTGWLTMAHGWLFRLMVLLLMVLELLLLSTGDVWYIGCQGWNYKYLRISHRGNDNPV